MHDSVFKPWIVLAAVSLMTGCVKDGNVLDATWHQKFNWVANEYFDDPKVVELCRAIEANDIAKIDALVADGADVNAQGKGKMTPLLWAFPDNKLDRFKRLLEHGANPNVVIDDDFNTRGALLPGDSVTHMACRTAFNGYFDAVFAHGGDPNLIRNGVSTSRTPLFTVIGGSARDRKKQVVTLIEKRANLNHQDGSGATPAMSAVTQGGQYDIALVLLNAGADHGIYLNDSNSRLIHLVMKQESLKEAWSPQQNADYQDLVRWLEEHGESLQTAREDLARWKSWSGTPAELAKLRRNEIAERKARESEESDGFGAQRAPIK
jgi:uncharacterized protein